MRVIICGSRYWTDIDVVSSIIEDLDPNSVVITGGCRGVDQIAHTIACKNGMLTEVYPADWSQHGRSAGPKRNLQMLQSGVDLVIALHPNITESRGTRNMLSLCHKHNVSYFLMSDKDVYEEIFNYV